MNIFISFLVLVASISAQIVLEECKKQNQCQCKYNDGTGYDLDKVVNDDNPLEAITDQENGLKFFYHPCGDTKVVPINETGIENSCKAAGYTLCMFDIRNNKTVVLGTQNNMEFRMDQGIMQVDFRINATLASIALVCNEKARSSILYPPLGKIEEGPVLLTLFSKFSCPQNVDFHGNYYKIVIVQLMILTFLYVVVIKFYKYLFGTRHYEPIP